MANIDKKYNAIQVEMKALYAEILTATPARREEIRRQIAVLHEKSQSYLDLIMDDCRVPKRKK